MTTSSWSPNFDSFCLQIIHMYGPVAPKYGLTYVVLDRKREPLDLIYRIFMKDALSAMGSPDINLYKRNIIIFSLDRLLADTDVLKEGQIESLNQLCLIARLYDKTQFKNDFKREVKKEDVFSVYDLDKSRFFVEKSCMLEKSPQLGYQSVLPFFLPFERISGSSVVQLDVFGNAFFKEGFNVVYLMDFAEDLVDYMQKFLIEMPDEKKVLIESFDVREKLKARQIVRSIKELIKTADLLPVTGCFRRIMHLFFSGKNPEILKSLDNLDKILSEGYLQIE